jgi:hypothetical protein
MRRPLRVVGGVFAAFDGHALPTLIRVRELFRALRSEICDRGQPLRASGLSATAWPYLGGSFPNSSARAWLPDLFIISFPHTWWILSRFYGSHSLEALSWRDVAGEIRLRRTGYWAPICTRDSGSTVGGENYADLVRGGLVVAGFAAGDAIHEAVPANPYVHPRLAEAATLLAPTLVFWLLTLGAAVLGGAGSGGHEANVTR